MSLKAAPRSRAHAGRTGTFEVVSSIAAFFSTNIALQLSNKWIASEAGLRFPISIPCMHMMSIALLGSGLTWAGLTPYEPIRSRTQALNIFVLSACVSLSLVTGIWCLQYITVAMDVAVGCTTPAWAAIMVAAVLGLHEPFDIWVSLGITIIGSLLANKGDPMFDLFGVTLAVISTIARAGKSVLQQKLMSSDEERLSPISLTRYMAAFSLVILLPFAAFTEQWGLLSALQRHMTEPTDANWSGYSVSRLVPSVLLVNVLLAFAFTVAQYWMTKATGAVTSQVVGTAKNAILSVLSFVIFGDAVTLLAFMGYVVVFCGAGLYTYLRIHGRRAVPAGSAKQ